MQSCADVLEPLRLSEDPLTLEFKGLGNFRNQVVFVNVEEGPCLERLKTMAGLHNLCTFYVSYTSVVTRGVL